MPSMPPSILPAHPTIPIVSAGAPVEPGLPCPTLHISNLNERIRPSFLIAELRRILTPYGHIHRITCKRRLNLRGQAFVVFASQADASRALSAVQTKTLYGKSMVIRYARRPSDITVRTLGGKEGLLAEKAARRMEKAERARIPRLTKRQRLAHAMASGTVPVMQMSSATMELPNKTVFLQGLPKEVGDEELVAMLRRYIGFVEFRRVPDKPEIGFAEFETEAQAGVVRNGLDRHELRAGQMIRVSYAKR